MPAKMTYPEGDPVYTAGGASDIEVEAIRQVLASADASEIANRLAAVSSEQASRIAADALKQDAATASTDAERDAAIAGVYPWRVDIVPFTNTIFIQGAKGLNGPGTAAGGGQIYNSGGALNDEYGWDVVLGAGTWQIESLMSKQNNAAIASVRLDGSEVGTWDTYAAASASNASFTVAGIVVPTSGKKRLTLKATGRFAANTTGYYMILQALSLRRTA